MLKLEDQHIIGKVCLMLGPIDVLLYRMAWQDLADPVRRVRKVRRQTGQLRQLLHPWTSQPGGGGGERTYASKTYQSQEDA